MTYKHSDYKVGWISALPVELAAAKAMLDEIHAPLPQPHTDPNSYLLGTVKGHWVVLASLPSGIYGKVSAATVASHLLSTFPQIQYGLMVGIGGGVPNLQNDIRLGDVVVGKPTVNSGGVIQYDFGKTVEEGRLKQTGILNHPPQILLTHLSRLQADNMTTAHNNNSFSALIQDTLELNPSMKEHFSPPSPETDYLFHSTYQHIKSETSCMKCDKDKLVNRRPRVNTVPLIHYGLIASGDQVMKDSVTRDRLAQELGIICFEMEAAGLANNVSTLVIRGICDYSDSHKQKGWQGYAALTAAAYAKMLLSVVPVYQNKTEIVRHWMVPLPRNPRFVGRYSEIAQLEESLTKLNGPRKLAITGLGGVGKTQVALELAYRVKERDDRCSIFWVRCTSSEMIHQDYLTLAQMVGYREVKLAAEARNQVQTYLSSQAAGKWLLIFDNLDDRHVAVSTLEGYLPQSENGHILFTSRNRQLALDLAAANITSIPDVDRETASKILEKSVQKELLGNQTETFTLLERLAFLPLAITQASAYINKNGIQLATYLDLLQQQEPGVAELLSKDFKDEGRYKDVQNPVITTWLISFQQIQQQNPLAAGYLSLIACISPQNIPISILSRPESVDRNEKFEALGLLNAYSFITWQHNNRLVSMHRLVHLATRNWLAENELFDHWVQQTAGQMQDIFPDSEYTNRNLWREYIPHALSLVYENLFIKQQDKYVNLMENIAACLSRDGEYFQAELLYTKLTKIYLTKGGMEDSDTLKSMGSLANIFWNQGRWQEAKELQIQVLEMRKRVLGSEHPDTLKCMGNLASTFSKQGRWQEAEELKIQVLEMRKRVLGSEHPDTLHSMGNLASTFWKQGRWQEAEELEIQVLEMRKRVLGSEHPDTLHSMGNLASTFSKQGRWQAAEELKIQVLEMRKRVLGSEHPDTLHSMGNLASTFSKQGRWQEAEELEIQVLEMRKKVLGFEHPDTLHSMGNLASTFWKQGRWQEAEELEIQVLEMRKKVLGFEHPDTLRSMGNLAVILWDQGRQKEAEELEIQVLEMRKKVLGSEHPDTLLSMHNLAYTWKSRNKRKDAIMLMTECVRLGNKCLGHDHPNTKSSTEILARWNAPRKRDALHRMFGRH